LDALRAGLLCFFAGGIIIHYTDTFLSQFQK